MAEAQPAKAKSPSTPAEPAKTGATAAAEPVSVAQAQPSPEASASRKERRLIAILKFLLGLGFAAFVAGLMTIANTLVAGQLPRNTCELAREVHADFQTRSPQTKDEARLSIIAQKRLISCLEKE